jgi:protein disulfide-isomerase
LLAARREVGKLLRVKKIFRLAMLAAILTIGCERPTNATPPSQATSSWLTDFKQAQRQAKANKKLLLLNFTGSDWCGYCIVLDRQVFSQQQFKEYANKNLVLMEVDFPRRKAQPTPVKIQNEELAQKYGVEGYPTIIVLNSDGKALGALGYTPGLRAESFIAALEKLRKS